MLVSMVKRYRSKSFPGMALRAKDGRLNKI